MPSGGGFERDADEDQVGIGRDDLGRESGQWTEKVERDGGWARWKDTEMGTPLLVLDQAVLALGRSAK
nr:unnamed protein product [Digitaria exilis]